MKKKILFSILAICILVTACLCMRVAASAEVVEIGTADALIALMNDSTKWGGDYKLTADIDLTGKTQSPIGTSPAFTGTFDGDGHTISGISISGAEGRVGLFGYVSGATIENLTVSGTVTGGSGLGIGGLVGVVDNGVTIRNCVNECSVTVTSTSAANIGGLVGYIRMNSTGYTTTIDNCENRGTIAEDTTGTAVGGLIGGVATSGTTADRTMTISNLTNNGTVSSNGARVGGIVGSIEITTLVVNISKCENNGSVSSVAAYAGGIVGFLKTTSSSADYKITVTQCLNNMDVTGLYSVGGIVGAPTAANLKDTIEISDCMNTGGIAATGTSGSTRGKVGGILGCPDTTKDFLVTNVYNTGAITGNSEYCRGPIYGYKRSLVIDSDCYYYNNNGDTYYNNSTSSTPADPTDATAVTAETLLDKSTFAGLLEDEAWVYVVDKGPELAYFHQHTFTEMQINGDQTVSYTCSSCENTVAAEDYITDVYVSSSGSAITGCESADDLGTNDKPFKNMTDALNYAACAATQKQSGVTVHIKDTASTGTNYTAPACDYMITITGGTYTLANRFFVSGPVTFENIALNNTAATIFVARCRKIVIGEGVTMQSGHKDFYLLGGFQTTLAVPDSGFATDVTVRSGEWLWIVGGNRQGSTTYAGNATTKIVVGKKNDDDTLSVTNISLFDLNNASLTTATGVFDIEGDVDLVTNLYLGSQPTNTSANFTVEALVRGSASVTSVKTTNKAYTNLTVYPDLSVTGAETLADTFINTFGGTVGQICTYLDENHVDDDGDNSCDKCGYNVSFALGAETEAYSQILNNGTGYLRVFATAHIPRFKTVESFGVAMVPLAYYNANPGTENIAIYNASSDDIALLEEGKTFHADLRGIPAGELDTPIYAWVFAQYSGEDNVRVFPLGTFTVNDNIYTPEVASNEG